MNDALPDLAGAILTVDLDAVAENYRRLKQRLAPGTACAGVVKANGYGLGAAQVARRLHAEGCRVFFVAQAEEAVALRPLLPDATIAVLAGLMPGSAEDFAAQDIVPVLNDPDQVHAWTAYCAANDPARIAIVHVDTGMTRLGLDVADALAVAGEQGYFSHFSDVMVMSHLVVSEEPDNPINAAQLAEFKSLRQRFGFAKASFANSSGIFLGADYHFDLARPGYALYGGNPTPGQPNPMQRTVQLLARVLQVRDIATPRAVGYGATASVAKGARIATIASGYADGYLRSLSNRGKVWIGAHAVPVVGRVSMDLITIDVSSVPREACQVGDFVELLGGHCSIDDLAELAGTNGYEILTSLGARYQRAYIGDVESGGEA